MGPLRVASVTAVSMRLLLPWVGVWTAEADLDLGSTVAVPTGRVNVDVGGMTLSGTVDARGTGRFGEKARVRVVGGAAGWSKVAPRRHFHNDAGVTTRDVFEATASAVGESIVVTASERLGVDYVRGQGTPEDPVAASAVLDGTLWYVDADGVTKFGPRSSTPSADVEVLSWDPDQRRAELAADTIVWPGTKLADPRFGTVVVRDVEQLFDPSKGSRLSVWCFLSDSLTSAKTEASRLIAGLATAARRAVHPELLRPYRYRIEKLNVDGRLYLQAVTKAAGVPDTLPITVVPGMAGDSADHVLGTTCLVWFVDGPQDPVVLGFTGEKVPTQRRVYGDEVLVGDAGAVALAKAAQVQAALDALKANIGDWTVSAGDGGAAFKTLLTAPTTGFVANVTPVATTKAKGT